MSKIAVIDYALGNIGSVQRALSLLGYNSDIISKPEDVKKSEILLLPGVGAFNKGMSVLESSGLKDAIKDKAKTGNPIIGICLGMQILMSSGQEGGQEVEGLDLIEGSVKKLSDKACKVPHYGWSQVSISKDFLSSYNEQFFYFVHSYAVDVKNKSDIIATTTYGENNFPSIIARDNVFGFQFHPEKSAKVGLSLIKSLLESQGVKIGS